MRNGLLLKTAVCVVGVLLSAGLACAETAIAKIDIYPPDVHLNTSRACQPYIVVATRSDGVTEDVTAKAKAAVKQPSIARLDGHNLLPAGDGQTVLQVEFGGRSASVPITVIHATAPRPILFKVDVMPIFMRAGCNQGSCHGSARGQDGFHLSLFGYDPDGDYDRLTREVPFRRINLAVLQESLLMEKAAGAVPHSGGKRFSKESEYYQTLLEWLRQGAPADPADVPKVVAVELYPPQAVLEGEGAQQQMLVRAKYSDGTDRDVTRLALFLSNNDNSAVVSPEGLVKSNKRGEAFVMARFSTYTVGGQVLVLPAGLAATAPGAPPANYIDELVNAKLQKMRIAPSGICSDPVFLRRVTLDITGRLPTVEELNAFTADTSPDKRAKRIDALLKRKEFAEIWAMQWAELLMIRSNNEVSYKSAFLYASWLTNQISKGVPMDQLVRQLLSASGGTFSNPATNFYQIETDTLKTAENVSQAFMGIRVQCAQCHNHPFDRWTMDDYYSFAAFFAQIGRKQGEDYRETIVFNRGDGEVQHPVRKVTMPPKFLGGARPDVAQKDRRRVLAEWITSPENPYFAANMANRIWAHFFGIGIVEPVDDVRVSNPPSNAQLLQTLGKKLTEYNYDFRRLVHDICLSQAYQRSTQANASNADDQRNFARARIRRIRAEILLDCVSQATETKDKFPGLPLGARAVQIADGTTTDYFLTTFGRAARESVCAADVRTDPTLSQALHLLNGETIENKIRAGGLIKRWRDEGKSPKQIIDELYIRCLSRIPTAEEMKRLNAFMAEGGNSQTALENVFWAILNSREFLFNH